MSYPCKKGSVSAVFADVDKTSSVYNGMRAGTLANGKY